VEEQGRNRWFILIASILCNLSIGSAYAWSVFQKPLLAIFPWTPSEASLAFTLSLAVMPVAMIIAGRIQDRQGPRLVMMIGGAMYGIGVFAIGYGSSLTFLYLMYGVFGGLGIGTVYACAIANTVKWVPDKRGLASGLIAAGLGAGAVVFAPVGTALIQNFGVLSAFKILGVGYLVVIVGCASFVVKPPADYRPKGWQPPAVTAMNPGVVEKNWRDMLTDPMFYVLWVTYTAGAVSGLMLIGHASPIGQEVIKLTAAMAAMAVSVLALANTGGRIFWGWVADKIGRYQALTALYAAVAAMMFFLPNVSQFVPFVIVISTVGLCYGGLLGIFPIITADLFGMKNLGMNYGIMFSAVSAAAVIGPRLAALVKEASGGYNQAFLISAVLSACGMVLILFVKYQSEKRRRQNVAAAEAR